MPRDRQAEPQLLLKVFIWSRVVGVEAVAGGWSGWRPRPSARVSLPEGSIQEMRIQWLLRGKKSPGQESAVGCGQGLGGPGCQTRALPPGRWAALVTTSPGVLGGCGDWTVGTRSRDNGADVGRKGQDLPHVLGSHQDTATQPRSGPAFGPQIPEPRSRGFPVSSQGSLTLVTLGDTVFCGNQGNPG